LISPAVPAANAPGTPNSMAGSMEVDRGILGLGFRWLETHVFGVGSWEPNHCFLVMGFLFDLFLPKCCQHFACLWAQFSRNLRLFCEKMSQHRWGFDREHLIGTAS